MTEAVGSQHNVFMWCGALLSHSAWTEGSGAIKAGGVRRVVLPGVRTCSPFEGRDPPGRDGAPGVGLGVMGGGVGGDGGGGLPAQRLHCAVKSNQILSNQIKSNQIKST